MSTEDFNPYQAPEAVLEDIPVQASMVLADRGTRFAAQFVDGLITGIPSGLLAFGAGLLMARLFPGYVRGTSAAFVLRLVGIAISVGVFLAINGWLLASKGQTIGKKICSIRIARPDGSVPTLSESFVRRWLVFAIPGVLPMGFAIVAAYLIHLTDVLFIFRDSHKCLHDDLAGTIVLKS